jgi:hypothetical protein
MKITVSWVVTPCSSETDVSEEHNRFESEGFRLLLEFSLYFDHEDAGDMFLRNVRLSLNNMALQARKKVRFVNV